MDKEPWLCPDCFADLDDDPNITPQPIALAQQERCIRPDCIVRYVHGFKLMIRPVLMIRSKRSINKKRGDYSRHVVERIIG
jgi:hypothetical protein